MKTYAIALLCLMSAGCAPSAKRTRTIVTGRIEPRHFQFYTVVKQRDNKAGGWRAACVHLNIQRKNTGESFVCTFGVEVPMQNKDMPISVPLAQRIAAERTDEAARLVFGAATPASPLGLLCEAFKKTLRARIQASIGGSRLETVCREEAVPVQFGEFIP
ncbi:hypothetical protein [Archangium sp.]|uniref:hypothetical protein n=1 Tax=Archangium sp. TaxID=1872627 RepID=UPI00286D3D99|nr:hypothetical protein [Archangium sp.]